MEALQHYGAVLAAGGAPGTWQAQRLRTFLDVVQQASLQQVCCNRDGKTESRSESSAPGIRQAQWLRTFLDVVQQASLQQVRSQPLCQEHTRPWGDWQPAAAQLSCDKLQ